MNQFKKIIFLLILTFLLLGASKKKDVIDYSKARVTIMIPKEDLSEEYQSENELETPEDEELDKLDDQFQEKNENKPTNIEEKNEKKKMKSKIKDENELETPADEELEELKKKLEEYKKSIDELKEQIRFLNEIKDNNKDSDNERNEDDDKIKEIQREIQELKKLNEKMYKDINESSKRFEEKTKDLTTGFGEALSAKEEIINNFKKKLRDTQSDYERDKEILNALNTEVENLRIKISSNKENTNKLESEMQELKELNEKMHTGINEANRRFEEKKEELNKISKLQDTKKKNLENEVKTLKNAIEESNLENFGKPIIIKTADYKIFPDVYKNNYDSENKGREFNFKQENTYYIEINPTRSLEEAKKDYNSLKKYDLTSYFIAPSSKNEIRFFRNLIKIENTNEMGMLYKTLKAEFKEIKIIK